MPVAGFLEMLREAGLSTLPGTVAKILDDEIRAIICPDKLDTRQSRAGPTVCEAVLMHVVARIAFDRLIDDIQASWVKPGAVWLRACLDAGVNDLGGTLMDESITRAAGAVHGQEFPPNAIEALIRSAGRTPRQRRPDYQFVKPASPRAAA